MCRESRHLSLVRYLPCIAIIIIMFSIVQQPPPPGRSTTTTCHNQLRTMSTSTPTTPAFILPASTSSSRTTTRLNNPFSSPSRHASSSSSSYSSSSATTRRLRSRCAVASPPLELPPTFDGDALRRRLSKLEIVLPCHPLVGLDALDQALLAASASASASTSIAALPVVVFFHARWCRVCKTIRYKLPSIAKAYPQFVWYDVDFAIPDNKVVCRDLDVKLLPTFRLYRPGCRGPGDPVDEFNTGPFGKKEVIQHLEAFLADTE